MRFRPAALALATILAIFSIPLAAEAQVAGSVYRVGILGPFSTPEGLAYREAFFDAMRGLGYVDGRNVVFDVRTSDRDRAQVPALVEELIALRPNVLVSDGNAARVIREKTVTVPIVLTGSIDPIGQGLAQSLRRPGMNVTGVALSLDQLSAKHIELIQEIRPRRSRIGLIVDTTSHGCNIVEESARRAARSVGAAFVSYNVANREDIARVFSGLQQERPDVLMPCPAALLFNNRDLLYENAVRLRIPFTSFVTENLPLGVLFSYSGSFTEGYRRAAGYVDKILKGERPADLPFEQPTTFELVINLRTAKVFGLTIPQSLLLRADRVIE